MDFIAEYRCVPLCGSEEGNEKEREREREYERERERESEREREKERERENERERERERASAWRSVQRTIVASFLRHIFRLFSPSASQRRDSNLKEFKDLYLKAKARI